MDLKDEQQLLDDLLTEWEDRVARGKNLSAEELCANHPEHFGEVQRHIRALQSFASRFGIESDDDASLSQSSTDDQATELPVRSIRIEAEYQLERLHGIGGLGSVYLAHDPQLNRRVAIKFPRGKRHSALSRLRFEREARITSRLDHPGIVPVHVIHTDSKGQPCYAMRFIEGDTLQVAIDRLHKADNVQGRPTADLFRSPGFRDLLRRFQVVCDIAAYGHSQSVIHRDIKPSNIMLGPFGETLLVDWGLAKILRQADDVPALVADDDAESTPGGNTEGGVTSTGEEAINPTATSVTATRSGQIIGTPAFASPEQLMGQTEHVCDRSDVFSLGATLYSLLTGEHLMQSCELPEHLQRIQKDRLPRPRDRRSSVPIPLDAVCHKALSIRAEDRYSSAQELSRDIERYLSDEPISIPCDGFGVRAARWLRKHATLATSVAVLIVVGLIAGITSSLILKEKNTQLSTAVNDLRESNRFLNQSNNVLAKLHTDKATWEEKAEQSIVTNAQILKGLHSLSDQVTTVFPNHSDVYTGSDVPFLRTLRDRYLVFSTQHGATTESLFIRAMGHLHVGGLSLCLDDLQTAETHLIAAKQDLLMLQVVSINNYADQCLARCCELLGECRRASGQRELAISETQEALARFDKLLAKKTADLTPDRLLHRTDTFIALTELQIDQIDVQTQAEQFAAAAVQLEDLLKTSERKLDVGICLIRALETEALVRARSGATEDARARLAKAIEVCETLLKIDPKQLRVRVLHAKCLHELSGHLPEAAAADQPANESSDALTAVTKAIGIQSGLVAEYPLHAAFRQTLVELLEARAAIRQRANLADPAAADLELAAALKTDEPPAPQVRAAEFAALQTELQRIRTGFLGDSLQPSENLLRILIPKLRDAIGIPEEQAFFLRQLAEALTIDAQLKIGSGRDAEADALLAEAMTTVSSNVPNRRAKLMFSQIFYDLSIKRSAVLNRMGRVDEAEQVMAAAGSLREDTEPGASEPAPLVQTQNAPPTGIAEAESPASFGVLESGTPDGLRNLSRQHRQSLLRTLEHMRRQYMAADNLPDAVTIWERQQQLLRTTRDRQWNALTFPEPDEGLSPQHWIHRNDDIVYVEVMGTPWGSVWGTGPYSDDSDLGTAAVHSGLLKIGELKFVAIRFLPEQPEFAGSAAYGITTNAYGSFRGAYEILGSGIRHTQYPTETGQPAGEPVNVIVVGNPAEGSVDGTDIYTSLSYLGATAVHCGLLEPGEVGLIRVESLPGLEEYQPSTRNGVTSLYHGPWPESIRLKRLH